MIDYCPNCGKKDIDRIDDDTIYCSDCDQTFKVTKGKVKPEKSGRIQQLEDDVEKLKEDNRQLKKDLYGREDFF